MKVVVEKTFLLALMTIHKDAPRTKTFLEDKRLTQMEREILRCWLLLRDNQCLEIFSILEKMSDSQSSLVLSQKYLIWGIALNNHGHFETSVAKIERALEELDNFKLPDHLFIACYNLFISNYNLHSKNGMSKSLMLLERLPVESPGQKISLWQCQLLFALAQGDQTLALQSIEKLEIARSEMSEPVVISYLVSKFRFEISCEEFSQAKATLIDMKKHRKFALTGNYQFMKSLLDYMMEDAALYVYKKNFDNCLYLYWQLKVIESFQRNDAQEAQTHWQELQKIHPQLYLANFEYQGEKSLFSLALKRVRQVGEIKDPLVITKSFNSKEEHLLSLLKAAKTPLAGAFIFKTIWNVDQVDFADYDKLKKLVSRVRAKHGIEIQFKKGCYSLVESKKLTKSS